MRGEAYVFTYNSSTSSYGQQGLPLTASDGAASSLFGAATAISADGLTVLVGGSRKRRSAPTPGCRECIYLYLQRHQLGPTI